MNADVRRFTAQIFAGLTARQDLEPVTMEVAPGRVGLQFRRVRCARGLRRWHGRHAPCALARGHLGRCLYSRARR